MPAARVCRGLAWMRVRSSDGWHRLRSARILQVPVRTGNSPTSVELHPLTAGLERNGDVEPPAVRDRMASGATIGRERAGAPRAS
jgi:hypothetical protein